MGDMSFTYSKNILNVVVVGQSGVGKSSLLNYIADKDHFKTGVGGAVTKGYFERYETSRNNTTYGLYDTEGLEPGKVDHWEKNIMSEIRKRDQQNDMAEWFHSVLFCISAESKRIQNFEIDAIRRMSNGGHVIVLLTKMDRVSLEILSGMKSEIRSHIGDQVEVLPVCSVSQRYRNGSQSMRQGLDEILATTFIGLWKKMGALIPAILLKKVIACERTIYYQKNLPCYISWNLLNGVANVNSNSLASMGVICKLIGLNPYNISLETTVPTNSFRQSNRLDCLIVEDPYGIKAMGEFQFKTILALPVTPSKEILDWGIFRKALTNYLIDWKNLYDDLFVSLRSFDESMILESLKKSIEVCKQVYQNVTGLELKKEVSLHDIQRNLKELKNLSSKSYLSDTLNKVKLSIKEVDGCTFFNGSELDKLVHNYGVFKATLDEFRTQYIQIITAVIKSIQQELRSFADYTLRSEDNDNDVFEISKEEFTKFLKIFKSELSRYEWDKCMVKMYNSNILDKNTRDYISSIQ